MLTPAQEKWIALLSDQDQVKILPWDATAQDKYAVVKQRIQAALGSDMPVEHRGATSLGISGQDEIDIYVPVPEEQFNRYLPELCTLFGEPHSHYPLERARFVTFEGGKHIDVFLINAERPGWTDSCKFDHYLRTHPETLDQYRLLKEAGHGLSTREYYRRKLDFLNNILALADQELEKYP
jgi:GrpB-like predicted nucleotidyltransferase (UPF0157 family)